MSVKKQILLLSLMPIIVIMAYFLYISFSIPQINVLAFLIAFLSFAFLTRQCLSLKLKWYFDLLLGIGWLLVILFGLFLVLDLIDHRNPDLANIREAQFCTRSGYGFVGTDGGAEIRAYKRFWIFNKEIGRHRISDMYDSPEDIMGVHEFCKDKKIVEIK